MRFLLLCLPFLIACGSTPEVQVVHDRDGRVRAEVTRRNGMKDGDVRLFHADGSLMTEGHYAKDSRHGAWTTINEQGDTLSIVVFRYGQKDGLQRYWAPNGQLLRMEEFKEGQPNGLLYRFFADGSPRQRAHYRNGILDGDFTEWFKVDSNSTGLSMGRYKHGIRDGRWTWFYANGNPRYQGYYRDGRQVGLWRSWDPQGHWNSTHDRGQ